MTVKSFIGICTKAGAAWIQDRAPTHGAALAYYSAFSVAPLLLITVSMASTVLGACEARSVVVEEISKTLGPVTAEAVSSAVQETNDSGADKAMTIIGLLGLLFGASGVFSQLQDALNVVWKCHSVPIQGSRVMHFIKFRLLSFAAVVGTGFLLLVSLLVSAGLAALSQWAISFAGSNLAWQALAALISFAFVTLLFALIFKLLPDAPVAWGDVWIGAALTAILFTLGEQLIGIYLGHAGLGSAYGAAGSPLVLLVWVYYSAQIVLFGAEFTYAYAQVHGSKCGKKDARTFDLDLQSTSST